MLSDEKFYARVTEEIARGYIDRVMWTKAFAHSGGSEVGTKSLYCRLRAEYLSDLAKRQESRIRSALTRSCLTELAIGCLLFLVGVVFSYASYNAAKPGDRYVVVTGLIAVGFLTACKGVARFTRAYFAPLHSLELANIPSSHVEATVHVFKGATCAQCGMAYDELGVRGWECPPR
jgi:hypothetical protein